ncbi:MAG: hypothetical protein KDD84_07585 [Caldilineaceae bacterium]|nr:hypothetical protein [Caldilineaceae bacterium]
MTINSLSTPRQDDFLRRVLPTLKQTPWLLAIWLSGSSARGDADRWSNVNLHVLIDVDPSFAVGAALVERLDLALAEGWRCALREDALIRGFTLIPDPMDVQRGGVHFDLRWAEPAQLTAHLDRHRPVRLLATSPSLPPRLHDALAAPLPALTPPNVDTVAANLSNFWIALSHLPALVNRQEHLAAARRLDDARQILVDLVVALNGADRPPSPSRVNQYLGPLQRDAFEKTLPVRAATAESWIGQAVALIVLYRWYAPQLVEIHPIDYPTALEKSVLALLSAEVDGWPAMVRSA